MDVRCQIADVGRITVKISDICYLTSYISHSYPSTSANATLQRRQSGRALRRVDDHIHADLAGADHLDVDARFRQRLKHPQPDARVAADADALYREDGDFGLVLHFAAELLQKDS